MVIEATRREERGKGAAKQMRRAGLIPAVLYGAGDEPVALTVDSKVAQHVMRTAGHTVVHEVKIQGASDARAILKDWLLDPVRGDILHLDLLRVAMNVRIRVRVPVHTVGEPQGVKVQGGIFERVARDIEVECLPGDIPDEINVDVTELTIGRQLRASDLPFDPSKVRLITDPRQVIAHVIAPTKEEEAAATEVVAAAPVAAATPSEPELIKRGKKEAEEGEEGGEKGE